MCRRSPFGCAGIGFKGSPGRSHGRCPTEPGISPTVTHYQQLATEFCKQLDAIAVAVVDQVPELQSVNRLDVAAARDKLQYIEAFRPVADKLAVLYKSMTSALAVQQSRSPTARCRRTRSPRD